MWQSGNEDVDAEMTERNHRDGKVGKLCPWDKTKVRERRKQTRKNRTKKKESLTERGTWLSILLYLCTWVGWEERYPGGLEDAYTRAKRNIEKDASALTGNHDLAGRLLGKKASGVLVIISWMV